jgi:CopG family nickel-responsive transcriptional regulator
MRRTTITLDEDLVAQLDDFMRARGYANRSEAIRDLVRGGLEGATLRSDPDAHCVGAAVYVYDHEARDLSRRLTNEAHAHHHLALSTMHVHLDHDSCMEVTLLRGTAAEVQGFADQVITQRGVRHGQLVLVPVQTAVETHRHGKAPARPHSHLHLARARRGRS